MHLNSHAMKTTLSTLFALFVFIGVTSAEDKTGGWNLATWGMTAEQIRMTYPSSQVLTTPETYQFGGGRYSCTLVLPHVPIANEIFDVHFLMDGTSTLAAVQIQKDFPIPMKGLFDILRDMLAQKYGSAFSDEDASNSSFASGSRIAKWQSGNTQITLRYLITPRDG